MTGGVNTKKDKSYTHFNIFGSSPKKLQIEQKDYIKTSFPQRRESSKKP